MKLFTDHHFRATKVELRAAGAAGEDALPAGVCGRITGIALVYGIVDDYGTVFAPGCLAKTVTDKVRQAKVKLLADHGPYTDMHIGTVIDIRDVGDTAMMTADLLDTEAGRRMKEYIEAVIASGGETGLSVGFRPKDQEWVEVAGTDKRRDMQLIYKEIELREISVTPANAVPGADVVGVRRTEGEDDQALLLRALKHILLALPERDAKAVYEQTYATSAATPDTPDSSSTTSSEAPADAAQAESATDEKHEVSMDDRIRAYRESFAG